MPSDGLTWDTTDPNGRRVYLRDDTVDLREGLGKHADASHMTTEEAQLTVENPHIIQQSVTDDDRESYYRYEEEVGRPPYKRVTVVVESKESAFAISWGRQGKLPKHEVPIWVKKRR